MKLFGIIDLFAGFILIFGGLINAPNYILMGSGILLIGKSSLGFLKDFASWIDFIAGLILIISILFSFPWWIGFLFGLILIQKGVFSFL